MNKKIIYIAIALMIGVIIGWFSFNELKEINVYFEKIGELIKTTYNVKEIIRLLIFVVKIVIYGFIKTILVIGLIVMLSLWVTDIAQVNIVRMDKVVVMVFMIFVISVIKWVGHIIIVF